jgi:hypothetical protein
MLGQVGEVAKLAALPKEERLLFLMWLCCIFLFKK